MKKIDAWMPLYIADYLADTQHLTAEQHGAYLLLLMQQWRSGPLPIDLEELAMMAKLDAANFRKKVWPKVSKFFDQTDEGYSQKRLAAERTTAEGISAKRAVSGRAGATNKWSSVGQNPGEATDKMPSKMSGKTRSERLSEARQRGNHTADEWASLKDATGRKCVRCGAHESSLEGASLTKDHIVPIYQGGDDSIRNLQPFCRNCNSAKGSNSTDYRPETWQKYMAECLAKRLANACRTPGPSPSPIQKEESNPHTPLPNDGTVAAPPAGRRGLILEGFDEWWKAYPRKVAKGAAEKVWQKAVASSSTQTLIDAVKRKAWPTDPQFIPHPATWLSQKRWLDDDATVITKPDQRPTPKYDERYFWPRKAAEIDQLPMPKQGTPEYQSWSAVKQGLNPDRAPGYQMQGFGF
ncbi:MAG TPA: DUF1376 domain-containing protein [Acidiphilium sp.]|nr:DUF1376 domain-containing protein [Acidiphilium sp.]